MTPCHCPPSGCSSTLLSVTLGALTRFRYLSLKVCLSASQGPPQPFTHYLISAAMTPLFGPRFSNINLCSHRNQTGQRALNGVYFILLVQTACTQSYSLLSLIVHEFGCRRVLLGFHSPACCLPPFAIQTSTHEASCEAEAALPSSVSHWRQSFQALAKELINSGWNKSAVGDFLVCWQKKLFSREHLPRGVVFLFQHATDFASYCAKLDSSLFYIILDSNLFTYFLLTGCG